MPLQIVRENIVHMKTDAIVNSTNFMLIPSGGVCGSIYDSAGYENMMQACNVIGKCKEGQAFITPGFNLFAKYVIHTVGPSWKGGKSGEENLLPQVIGKKHCVSL